ncbi:MAG: sulfite exporter TauE/SafE family protein [Patescibacteria group bacterium]
MADSIRETYTFHVHGMHCKACVALTESALADVPEVKSVKASLANLSVEVTGEFGDKAPEHIARDLSEVLKPHGYTLSLEKQKHTPRWSDFNLAFPLAAGFIGLFLLLQKLDIVNLATIGTAGYGTAFFIGLVASVSTCMAVVGGLVLSMSSTFAKGGDAVRPQILFHIGRLASFFILGGVIGALGSVLQLGVSATLALGLLVGIVLLILGVNLLDIFPWMKRLAPSLPAFVGKRIHGLKNVNHVLTPVLIGIATFFLPCGFTQSMQLYALTTGSFWTGAITMFVFALGTLPVLSLLSFGSLGIHTKTSSGVFFKTAGLVVVFFGLLNIASALSAYGIIPPLFNF